MSKIDTAGLAEALLVGYKQDLDPETVSDYTSTGIVHVIAISGMHLGIIYLLLHALQRKYGPTLADVLTFAIEAREKLRQLEARDSELARLNSELAALDVELLRAGRELTAARLKVIPKLTKAVTRQLQDLGFRQSELTVEIGRAHV